MPKSNPKQPHPAAKPIVFPRGGPKPEIMWALYNYGRLMGVEFRKKDFAKIFCGGEAEFNQGLKNGTVEARRCLVTPSIE